MIGYVRKRFTEEEEDTQTSYKAEELQFLLFSHAPSVQLKQFLTKNQQEMPAILRIFYRFPSSYRRLFDPEVIQGLDKEHVEIICKGPINANFIKAILSPEIAAEKKIIFFYNLLLYDFPCALKNTAEESIFIENAAIRDFYAKCSGDESKRNFIQRTSSGIPYNGSTVMKPLGAIKIKGFNPNEKTLRALCDDQVSVFEINRQLEGKSITSSMLLSMLHNHAVNCFVHLLTRYPKQVYRIRSAEEWLFTVCRHALERFAVPVVKEIESQNPGIVANTRDPWGNTLLWNTLANKRLIQHRLPEKINILQETLVSLGCNPDEMNPLGLSFRVAKAYLPIL